MSGIQFEVSTWLNAGGGTGQAEEGTAIGGGGPVLTRREGAVAGVGRRAARGVRFPTSSGALP